MTSSAYDLIRRVDAGSDLGPVLAQILREQLARQQAGDGVLHLPLVGAEAVLAADTQYHVTPELFLQVSGVEHFRCGKQELAAGAGECTLLPRFTPHAERGTRAADGREFHFLVVCPNEQELVFILCGAAGDGTIQPMASLSCREPGLAQCVQHLCDALAERRERQVAAGEPPPPDAGARLLLSGLLLLLLQFVEGRQRHQQAEASPVLPDKVGRTRRLVAVHLADPRLSLGMIAGILKCSPAYLSHLFFTETGRHLTDHINRRRVEMAEQLIRRGGLNLKEIAWACGFRNAAYFSRVFRRVNGQSPRLYRHSHLADSAGRA